MKSHRQHLHGSTVDTSEKQKLVLVDDEDVEGINFSSFVVA